MEKICFIGCVGIGADLYDGQTLKTRIIYNHFLKRDNCKIYLVDTYKKKQKFLLLFQSILALLKCNKVICLLSKNGRKFYFKLFNFIKLFKKIEVTHIVIGGFFSSQIKNNKKEIKVVNKFKNNIVETNLMLEQLKNAGVVNGSVVPNFRSDAPLEESPAPNDCNFVMFCRIMKEKGVSLAIEALKNTNIKLDLYGPISDSYLNEFNQLIKSNKNISYKGSIDRESSKLILKNYFMMLFPTQWEGEGFPGTIIDAFYSGLPVIASDWNSNSEIIKNYETGIVIPNISKVSLLKTIQWCVKNKNTIDTMRLKCIKEANKFTDFVNFKKIEELIF